MFKIRNQEDINKMWSSKRASSSATENAVANMCQCLWELRKIDSKEAKCVSCKANDVPFRNSCPVIELASGTNVKNSNNRNLKIQFLF